jgi:DNA modification methylase
VGTTTLVAHRLGRRYIGIDISRGYCAIARKRLASAQAAFT